MKPWVTIIIPTFNRGAELKRCLVSLINQSNKDFNVVICDDGSTFDIDNYVNEFQSQLNLLILKIVNSGGPARPRNTALQHVHTEWVCFLDSDDWWSEFKLENIKLFINGYDFIYHKLNVVNGSTGKIIGEIGKKYKSLNIVDGIMTEGNNIPASSVAIKYNLIKNIGFDENLRLSSFEDANAWIAVFYTNTIVVKFLNKILGCYSQSSDSISKLSAIQVNKYLFFYKNNIDKVSNLQVPSAYSYRNYIIGTQYLYLGNYKKSMLFLSNAKGLTSKIDTLKLYFKKLYCLIKT